ncbi:arabinose efflux permease [Longilinea arvoryzae]|uniref:Arabinose efflux permease n=1 Tax=Longilinea arvoryzae TaxID=360412 RepID=A0A0S7BLA1_9CHLR|nr:MFS transporter [Longilinea arvoryzae]GAP14689.1 arabinose efflux permease [Longilinea arvoryzae]
MKTGKYRWFVVGVFFFFMLLHQADKLLIGPLTTPIMDEFHINETQMGLLSTGAIIVGAIFYPVWGYLCDRYSRAKLLSLASLIWGATTWLSAIAPTYSAFMVTRSSTGIDDSSYPGLYSLIADYFPPKARGKVYGLLQIAMPMGYLIGMVLALVLGGAIGWRSIFYITGSLGILMAIVIFFGVKEPERGTSEPEMENIEQTGKYHFDWKIARDLFKKRSLILLFLQGFVGVFPWQVITFWFFRYLETERGFSSNEVLITMVIAILLLAAGYPIGGALGDWLFGKTKRGRVIVSAIGVITGAALLFLAIRVPYENKALFTIMMAFTAVFIPFASPNVLSTVYDVTLPEVRSTANSIQYFIEQGGSAVAPTLAGIIAMNSSLENSILTICISAWILCFLFFLGVIYLLPKDIDTLRKQMTERAQIEQSLQPSEIGD